MYNELNLENLQEPMVTLNEKGEARVTFNDYTDLSIGAKSLLRLCLNGLYAIGNKDYPRRNRSIKPNQKPYT